MSKVCLILYIFSDTALATSFPHYLYADEVVKTYVDGLEPNAEKHDSYVIVEPVRTKKNAYVILINISETSNNSEYSFIK